MVKLVAVVAIGFLAIMVGYAGRAHFLSPGPVTTAHSALTNCSVCHANVADSRFGWLHAVFAEADAKQTSSACLKCHNMAETALRPHGLAMEELERRNADARQMWGAKSSPIALQLRNAVFPSEELAGNEIYCASCHKEHRGERFRISETSDDQCQTCHTAQFASFRSGHPEPKDSTYPFNRRTRIKFDHALHFDKHFPEAASSKTNPKQAPGACGDCHVPGPGSRQMVVLPFERTCASCHLGQITGEESAEASKGIALLALPGLDLLSLRDKGADIGYWPEEPYDLGITLTPLLKLFIGADAGGRQLLADLKALDLIDLREATDEQVALVEDLVWKIKTLVYTFATSKMSDAEQVKHFTRQFNLNAAGPQLLTQLTASVPRDVWIRFKDQWLPGLDEEMKMLRAGKSVPMPETDKSAPDVTQSPNEEVSQDTDAGADDGAILPGDDDGNPPGSDDILSGDDTDTAAPDDILSGDDTDTAAPDDILSGDDTDTAASDDILSGDDTDTAAPDDILSGSDTDTAAPDDILSGNDTDAAASDDILSGDDTDTAASDDILSGDDTDTAAPGDILSGSDTETAEPDDILAGETDNGEVDLGPGETDVSEADTDAGPPMSNQDWAEFGGWYRQDYEVRYKPATHADAFMRSWFDFTAVLLAKPQKELAGDVFRLLSAKGAPGQCTKCHSVDAVKGGGLEVNWSPASLANMVATFTRFSHAPHFSIKDGRGCLTCHALDREVDTRKWYFEQDAAAFDEDRLPVSDKFDPASFQSNFKPIEQRFCRSCHNAQASGDDCQLCHVYHVSPVETQHMARTTRITDDLNTDRDAASQMTAE